jgi:hypothetical protein
MLAPPAQYEQQVLADLAQLEKERKMPFITSWERMGMEKGLLLAIEDSIQSKFGAERPL